MTNLTIKKKINRIVIMFLRAPSYPCDLEELKEIENLLLKKDDYDKAIQELLSLLDVVSEKVSHSNCGSLFKYNQIKEFVLKSFFSQIENKEFSSLKWERLNAEIVWEGIIYKRNPPCEICGENRTIDKCHIIPNKMGGLLETTNLLFLCPTHHRLFDRFMLTKAEFGVIDWSSKSFGAQLYVEEVTLKAHKKFWNNIENKKYQKINEWELSQVYKISFFKEIVFYIRDLFYQNVFSSQNNILKLIDPNILTVCKDAIYFMKKIGIIVLINSENKKYLAFTVEKNLLDGELLDDIVRYLRRND